MVCVQPVRSCSPDTAGSATPTPAEHPSLAPALPEPFHSHHCSDGIQTYLVLFSGKTGLQTATSQGPPALRLSDTTFRSLLAATV